MTVRTVQGRRIYQARLAAGMTQADLAHALRRLGSQKTTERSVRNWEKEKHSPHADVVPAIAEATGVEITYLYETGDPDDEEDDPSMLLAALEQVEMPEALRIRVQRAIARTA